MKDRIIFHVDVNNAFLSWTAVYMLKNGSTTDIRKKYSVIGGKESERRGIILAKSTPCKQKGVITGETIYNARLKCPYLEVYPPNYKIYKEYSNQMYKYLGKYSPIIERYSIDECFLDYTDSQKLFGDPLKLAYKIKEDIKKNLGFTVNVGIGNNKLCAKMASDFSKPDKVHTLFQNEIEAKLWPLPISDLFMIGKQTSKKLKELNINTIYDLAHTDYKILNKHFKSMSTMMLDYSNGIDNSNVEYIYENQKSISTSTILPFNYSKYEEIIKVIKYLSIETSTKLRKQKMYAMTINVWIKYANFTRIGKQLKTNNPINTDIDIYNFAIKIFKLIWNEEPIRSICVGVANLTTNKYIQLDLFNNFNNTSSKDELQKTIDNINLKYGNKLITYADLIEKENIKKSK